MSAKVTAVIPTRDRPLLLKRALRSVLDQSMPPIQVVVVDDSYQPSGTEEIARSAEAEFVWTGGGKGGAEARNCGIAAARGDWVAFLDDDDEWRPTKLATQLASLVDEGCSFGFTRLEARSESDSYFWPWRLPADGENLSSYLFDRKSTAQGEGLLQTSTLVASRDLLTRVSFDATLVRHQDWDWALRASKADSHWQVHPDVLATWYVDDQRSRVSNAGDWRDSFEWCMRSRALFETEALTAFLLLNVMSSAAVRRDTNAIAPVIHAVVRARRFRLRHVLISAGFWLVPRSARRKLRRSRA